MNVEDYYPQGNRCWLRLQEKGGKQHEMPAHTSEAYLDEYVMLPASAAEKAIPSSAPGGRGRKQLTRNRMTRRRWRMIVRRA